MSTFIRIFFCGAFMCSFLTAQCQQGDSTQHLRILQASNYDTQQRQDFPDFTYQEASQANLVALKKMYRLDVVAGKGSDLSRIRNLLKWMHETVPHEDEANHTILNAQYIIKTYKEKGLAQGCYPLAIAMNEILLSMGFQSRIVICFAANPDAPNGGHVINTVYVPSLKKWIWIDPQYYAYLKSADGRLLSIDEVREHVRTQKPIVLNSDANYHGKPVDVHYYLEEFMLEHLYRFICPLHSKYNAETREPGKVLQYVELLPSNMEHTPLAGDFERHENADVKIVTYHTGNPLAFWKVPSQKRK